MRSTSSSPPQEGRTIPSTARSSFFSGEAARRKGETLGVKEDGVASRATSFYKKMIPVPFQEEDGRADQQDREGRDQGHTVFLKTRPRHANGMAAWGRNGLRQPLFFRHPKGINAAALEFKAS